MFADDTVLCAQNNNFSALEAEVNNELDKVSLWMASNKLTLNIKKSQYLIVSNKKYVPNLSIKIRNTPLINCKSYKYLGLHFDEKLNWNNHLQHISTKIAKACGVLAKLRHCVPIQTLVDVYNALVHSYIRYGVLLWGSASDAALKPLCTLINKTIRIISFAPYGNFNISQIYKELNLLNIQGTFSLELGKFAFKEKHELLPTKIGNHFQTTTNFSSHAYNTRTSNLINPSKMSFRLSSSKKSVQFQSTTLWEALPTDLKCSESVQIFKRKYKKALISDLAE